MEYCLFLCAQGWGTEHQVRKKVINAKFPGLSPRGDGNRELNHALQESLSYE